MDKCGDLSGRLFLGPKSNWSIHERLSGDLSQARLQKMNGNYREALSIINNILDQASDHSDALYVRAQILMDGFSDINRAKKYFVRIIKHEPEDSPLYRWAKYFKNQIEKNHVKQ